MTSKATHFLRTLNCLNLCSVEDKLMSRRSCARVPERVEGIDCPPVKQGR